MEKNTILLLTFLVTIIHLQKLFTICYDIIIEEFASIVYLMIVLLRYLYVIYMYFIKLNM